MTLTAREQTIETLLSWYPDVLHGDISGGAASGELGIKLMSRAWNSRTYQELHRCLLALRDEDNRTYWHVRSQYLAGVRKTVFACPKEACDKWCEVAARHLDKHGNVKRQCKHGGSAVFWVRKTVPVVSEAVRPEMVEGGIRWLARRFRGEPYVPADLLAKERAA